MMLVWLAELAQSAVPTRYRNIRIQVLLLRANDFCYRASRLAFVEAAAYFFWREQ